MLISEAYKEQNKSLHSVGDYGISGAKWAETIKTIIKVAEPLTILDYGCGQKTLQEAVGPGAFFWNNYDPCIPGLDAEPKPASLVICTDVLEHVEPECLESVLDDLQRLTLRMGFFTVSTRPAKKVLPDGRNAHLIQQGPRWWLPRFCERFEIVQMNMLKHEFFVVVKSA